MLRVVMDPPWSLRILDEAPLALVAVATGEAWMVSDAGESVRLGPGDVAIARGPDHYLLADDPATPPDIIILPGQECTNIEGESLAETLTHGVRTWGNSSDGSTVLLIGVYESMGEISERMLRALPPLLSLANDEWDCPLIQLLSDEAVKDVPGQTAVLDRLLDLLLIAVLRAWFARPEADAPAWYRAQGDPIIGRALRIMHSNPSHRWSVASLAAETGVSRAALARRFSELVGEPPMTFLTEWRLALAADLVLEPDATVTSVANKVGYSSPYAFSTAFKRVRGISPTEHRVRTLANA